MFSFFTSYFKTTALGTLYKNNKLYKKHTRISIKEDKDICLILDNKYEEEVFTVEDITHIHLDNEFLEFRYNGDRYKYIVETKDKKKLEQLYNDIVTKNNNSNNDKDIKDTKVDNSDDNINKNIINKNKNIIKEKIQHKVDETNKEDISTDEISFESYKDESTDADFKEVEYVSSTEELSYECSKESNNINDKNTNDNKQSNNTNCIEENKDIIYKGNNILFSIFNALDNKFTDGIEVSIELFKNINNYYLKIFINDSNVDRNIIYLENITTVYYTNKDLHSFTWSIKNTNRINSKYNTDINTNKNISNKRNSKNNKNINTNNNTTTTNINTNSEYNSFTLIFSDVEEFNIFSNKYFRCLVEDDEYNSIEGTLLEYKEIDYKEYDIKSNRYIDNRNIENLDNDSTYSLAQQKTRYSKRDEERLNYNKRDENNFNKQLCVGKKNIYVSTDNKINVFNKDLDHRSTYNCNTEIDRLIENMNNIYVTDKHNIQMVDIEKGKIIRNWNESVNDIISNNNKYNDDSTITGIKDNGLITLDSRVKDSIKGRTYKTKTDLLYGSRNNDNLAVVSKKGDLRLYSDINSNAKVLLPGYGDSCKGIDVSKNGRYVLRTYDYYMILDIIDYTTDVKDVNNKNDNDKNDVNKNDNNKKDNIKDNTTDISYKKVKKNTIKSIRLSLLAEHISLGILSRGTFSIENDIISSIGNYILLWKIKDILLSIENNTMNNICYEITRNKIEIVEDRFIDNSKEIVVATVEDIKKLKRK
ncbi:VID27 cytoplasmic protein [Spraguea lophii 42_110]|uniref:VID27 cytoplasmic protein n=1 Tax=Spraguea lophii (strain 42_110) TaxID=1358809 RepID=S7W9L5_SPRLO|nr:VID27 cytoplasmic protein [Spraguea lophii 42_110]